MAVASWALNPAISSSGVDAARATGPRVLIATGPRVLVS